MLAWNRTGSEELSPIQNYNKNVVFHLKMALPKLIWLLYQYCTKVRNCINMIKRNCKTGKIPFSHIKQYVWSMPQLASLGQEVKFFNFSIFLEISPFFLLSLTYFFLLWMYNISTHLSLHLVYRISTSVNMWLVHITLIYCRVCHVFILQIGVDFKILSKSSGENLWNVMTDDFVT